MPNELESLFRRGDDWGEGAELVLALGTPQVRGQGAGLALALGAPQAREGADAGARVGWLDGRRSTGGVGGWAQKHG